MRLSLLALSASCICTVLLACSDSSSSGTTSSSSSSGGSSSSSGGSAPLTAAECSQRCEAKLKECGAQPGDAKLRCDPLCVPTLTLDQLLCFDVRTCDQARTAEAIRSICLDTTGSNKVDLGAECSCADKTPDNEGLCGGSRTTCKVHLSCLYVKGSSGKGTCVGKECCDDEKACDANPGLMKSCNGVGTCKKGPQGYYCRP